MGRKLYFFLFINFVSNFKHNCKTRENLQHSSQYLHSPCNNVIGPFEGHIMYTNLGGLLARGHTFA